MLIKIGKKLQDKIFSWGLAIPSIIALTALSIYPFFTAVQSSFYNVSTITRETTFAGLDNYLYILKSELFWESLKRSFIWTFSNVSIQLVIAVLISLVLHQELKGRNFARGLVLIPYLIPSIVVAIVWRFLLNPTVGIVNYLLTETFHIVNKPIMWLIEPESALWTVILVGIWKYTPFMIILILGRLQTTPLELYDAAKVDGANLWQVFWSITFAWIKPVILVAVMLRTIWLFNHFDLVYLMAFGGPMDATTTVPVLIYRAAFEEMRMGRAAAISMYLVVFLLIATILYTWMYNRAEEQIRD
ncbi:sugar ABC transporter permease [Patescibacteria group bacterium]|nr:sugar ABC transporter permease [Patescibacteria group bacterium]